MDIMRLVKLLVLWMAVAIVQEAGAPPAESSKIYCEAPSVMEGQTASFACDYRRDVKEEHIDFVVVLRRKPQEQSSEILSCLWITADRPTCNSDPGYVMDEEISRNITLKIPSATKQHEGQYMCLTIPSAHGDSEPCSFSLKDPSETTHQTPTSAPTTDFGKGKNNITKGNEDGGNTSAVVAILIPVILTMLICAAVIIFKCWGRITERFGKDKTGEGHKRKVAAHYVTKEPELLSHTTSGNGMIKRPLSKDDADPALEPLVSSEESNATQTQSTIEQFDEVASPDGASDSNPLNAREDTGKAPQTGSSQDQTFTQPTDVKEKGKVKLPDSYLYNRAVGLLKSSGAVVIMGPEQQQQQYILGRKLMDHFAEQGFSALEFDHPNRWWEKRKGDKRYIVLLNELKTDDWLHAALKSMVQDDLCYVIIMISSDTRNSESGLPSCLQTVPTVDLGQTLTPEIKGAKQLLREACQKDDLEQVVTLLSAGFSPLWVDKESRTALHIACERGNAAIVENLLWAGSFVNARDKKLRTPLHFACSFPSEIIPAVQLDSKQTTTASNKVIEQGKDLRQNSVQNVTNDGEDLFSFPESSESPRETIVKRLLASGADPQATDSESRTPLHVACEHSYCTLVAMLLSVGADVNAVDKAGRTPLHVACDHDNYPSVTLLVKAGADVNAVDKAGNTPLHVACRHDNHDVVKSLLDAGADVNATDKTGRTPLHNASRYNSGNTVQSLICAKSDVDARENSQCTPLHLACFNGARDSVEILLRANANIETRTKFGMTPLHVACSRGNKEIVRMLLKKNADVCAKDDRNNTPGDVAASEGHKEIARILRTAENESRV